MVIILIFLRISLSGYLLKKAQRTKRPGNDYQTYIEKKYIYADMKAGSKNTEYPPDPSVLCSKLDQYPFGERP